MLTDIAVVSLFHKLIDAPEFAVQEHDTFRSCLISEGSVRNEALIYAVTEESIGVVISAVSENDAVILLYSLAVFSFNSLA